MASEPNANLTPFVAGNEVATTHGAYSPRQVDPLARELVAAVRTDVTWWHVADLPAVWAWARTESRIQLVWEWLDARGGDMGTDKRTRAATELLNRLEARAETLRGRLGLDPVSRSRMGRDKARGQVDMARLLAAMEEETDDGD